MKKKLIAIFSTIMIASSICFIPINVNAANPLTRAGKEIQRTTKSIRNNSKQYYGGYMRKGVKNKKPSIRNSAKYSRQLKGDFRKIGNTLKRTMQSIKFDI